MIHHIHTSSFHGYHHIRLRGPAAGFRLSPRQEARVRATLCGVSGCRCGGGYPQSEPDSGARLVQDGYDEPLRLVPEEAQ